MSLTPHHAASSDTPEGVEIRSNAFISSFEEGGSINSFPEPEHDVDVASSSNKKGNTSMFKVLMGMAGAGLLAAVGVTAYQVGVNQSASKMSTSMMSTTMTKSGKATGSPTLSKSGKACYTQEWLQTASEQQANYRGTISVTASGKTCQAWSSQTPWSHRRTTGNYPSSGLDANYCRNPDGSLGAWCYVADGSSRWEYCDVPTSSCSELAPEYKCSGTGNQADYRGTIARTVSGKTCQAWESQTPFSHTRTAANYPNSGLWSNYCRNPDGFTSAWCYTTDPSTRWELCDVPTCD